MAAESEPSAAGRLAVVVVNFGSHELLRANLDWAIGPAAGVSVVVVDNFRSAADAVAMAELAALAHWQLVAMPANVGFGAGLNRGAERAWATGADAMLALNPDLQISREQARALGDAVGAQPGALVSPLVLDGAGRPWGRRGRVDLRAGRLWTTDDGPGPRWLSGACLAVGKELWTALGGMDEDYFLYWEDIDLSVRAARYGADLVLLDDVAVVHDVGGTQNSSGLKSDTYYYYNCRNRLVFAAKLLGGRVALRWLVLTMSDVRRVIGRGRPQSRADKLRYALVPALRGCFAGVWWMMRRQQARPQASQPTGK